MNRTLYEFLKYLINYNGESVSFDELSEVFGVTERMIRNYIDDISVFLKKKNIGLFIDVSNSAIKIIEERKDQAKLKELFGELDFYDYKLSSEERKNLILLTILASDEKVRISELEKLLNSSRSSIQNDIASLKEEYAVVNSDKTGLSLEISESDKRRMIFDTIQKLGIRHHPSGNGSDSPYYSYVCDLFDLNRHLQVCKDAGTEAENILDIHLTDDDFYKLVFDLSICLDRIEKGNILKKYSHTHSPNGLVSSFVRTLYSSDALKKYDANEYEINYLADRIRLTNLLRKTSSDEDLIGFYIVVKSFVHRLSQVYDIDFSDNDSFIENLVTHIFSVYRGNNMEGEQDQSITDGLISQYKQDFEVIKDNVNILEKGLNCSFSDSDIALILVHVLSAIERHIPQNFIPNVIIVCNSGIGTSNFLSVSVKNSFRVNVAGVTSVHNLGLILRKEDPDLIISTIDLGNVDTEWVKVDPVLSGDDHIAIRNKLEMISRKRISDVRYRRCFDLEDNGDTFVRINELVKKDYCQIIDGVEDWKQGIRLSAEPLLKDGLIDENYISAMFDVVEEYGPYMVFTPGIAIAHARPGNTENGLSITKLKKPVNFGNPLNDPVWLIAVFSCECNINRMTVLNIMNTLYDPTIIKKIRMAQSAEEIYEIIQDY